MDDEKNLSMCLQPPIYDKVTRELLNCDLKNPDLVSSRNIEEA